MTLIVLAACLAGLEPVRTVPEGEYRLVRLELEGGFAPARGKPSALPILLSFRDGKPGVPWLLHPEASVLTPWGAPSTLKLAGGKLAGVMSGWASGEGFGNKAVLDYTFRIDATLEGGKLTGAYTGKWGAADLKGRVTGEEVKGEPLAEGKGWPAYLGDGQAFSGPDGPALLDDLAKSRPLWKSELRVPTSYGSGPDPRYATRAGYTGPVGGSSSPVVAGGRVYLFFTRPSGPPTMLARIAGGTPEATAAYAQKAFPDRPAMQALLVDFFREQADEVLACLDAATGRTLWETSLPGRGNNFQTHKHRGHFPVPLVAGGRVYVAGTTGRVYCLDAGDGKLAWEYPEAPSKPHRAGDEDKWIRCGSPSPVLLGGTLAVNAQGLVGLDAKTGKPRWKLPGAFSGPLLAWSKEDASRVLVLRSDHAAKKTLLTGIDPASGKPAFVAEVPLNPHHVSPLLEGDTLVGWSVAKAKDGKPGEHDGDVQVHAWTVSATGVKHLWDAAGPRPMVDTPSLLAHKGHVVVTGFKEAVRLELATGKPAGRVAGVGGARTQVAMAAGGRVLLQPEGRHGRQSFFWLRADAEGFAKLPASGTTGGTHPDAPGQWSPPHPQTTAYANQPLVSPLVDGRLFLRGRDAVYCYDLRSRGR
jgi:outer membrane protein assembly factor BamB